MQDIFWFPSFLYNLEKPTAEKPEIAMNERYNIPLSTHSVCISHGWRVCRIFQKWYQENGKPHDCSKNKCFFYSVSFG